jgi:hypothetical protein
VAECHAELRVEKEKGAMMQMIMAAEMMKLKEEAKRLRKERQQYKAEAVKQREVAKNSISNLVELKKTYEDDMREKVLSIGQECEVCLKMSTILKVNCQHLSFVHQTRLWKGKLDLARLTKEKEKMKFKSNFVSTSLRERNGKLQCELDEVSENLKKLEREKAALADYLSRAATKLLPDMSVSEDVSENMIKHLIKAIVKELGECKSKLKRKESDGERVDGGRVWHYYLGDERDHLGETRDLGGDAEQLFNQGGIHQC